MRDWWLGTVLRWELSGPLMFLATALLLLVFAQPVNKWQSHLMGVTNPARIARDLLITRAIAILLLAVGAWQLASLAVLHS